MQDFLLKDLALLDADEARVYDWEPIENVEEENCNADFFAREWAKVCGGVQLHPFYCARSKGHKGCHAWVQASSGQLFSDRDYPFHETKVERAQEDA